MSFVLPKPVLVAIVLIPFLVGGTLASAWAYAGYAVNSLQVVCQFVDVDSSSHDVLGTVVLKNPSLFSIDGTWKFLIRGVNGTYGWSTGDTVTFHIASGTTTVIEFKLPGLAQYVHDLPHSGALTVNATLFVFEKTYHVSLRSLNYTSVATNATVIVPGSGGAGVLC